MRGITIVTFAIGIVLIGTNVIEGDTALAHNRFKRGS
jgi:hypothetical protein